MKKEEYQEALEWLYGTSNLLTKSENKKILQQAIDKAIKYDVKETPLEPVYHTELHKVVCRKCEEVVHGGYKYCHHCGNKIDWSDNK